MVDDEAVVLTVLGNRSWIGCCVARGYSCVAHITYLRDKRYYVLGAIT